MRKTEVKGNRFPAVTFSTIMGFGRGTSPCTGLPCSNCNTGGVYP
jgi:hypothetical protein